MGRTFPRAVKTYETVCLASVKDKFVEPVKSVPAYVPKPYLSLLWYKHAV
jgi:hypothetical protein